MGLEIVLKMRSTLEGLVRDGQRGAQVALGLAGQIKDGVEDAAVDAYAAAGKRHRMRAAVIELVAQLRQGEVDELRNGARSNRSIWP